MIWLLFVLFSTSLSQAHLINVRAADRGQAGSARVVLEFSEKVAVSWDYNKHLVLHATCKDSDFGVSNMSRMVRSIKSTPHAKAVVITCGLRSSMKIDKVFWIHPNASHPFYRYVMDLVDSQIKEGQIIQESLRPMVRKIDKPKKTIIIDAGHGGRDSGTIGAHKTHEKNITLKFVQHCAKQLEDTGRYRVILVRDRDVSMTIPQRLKKIRVAKGDVFLSVHADSAPHPETRGLSVYTLSSVASDRQAERLAQKENKADLIVGSDLSAELPDVAHILIDLTKRETMNLSSQLAQTLVKKLQGCVFLMRNPHRFADFFILKTPGLPSILLELGYLSNRKEENLLRDPGHWSVIVSAIIETLDCYFEGCHE